MIGFNVYVFRIPTSKHVDSKPPFESRVGAGMFEEASR